MRYESTTSSYSETKAKVKVFESKSRSLGKKYMMKVLFTRNAHAKYESPTSSHIETMAKV